MAVEFDVIRQSAIETVLPLVGLGLPRPAGQVLSRYWRSTSRIPLAYLARCLLTHFRPGTDQPCRIADAGVTVPFDELLQQPEPELPRGGGLLDEAHVEGPDEIDADPCGNVHLILPGVAAVRPSTESPAKLVELLAELLVVGRSAFSTSQTCLNGDRPAPFRGLPRCR